MLSKYKSIKHIQQFVAMILKETKKNILKISFRIWTYDFVISREIYKATNVCFSPFDKEEINETIKVHKHKKRQMSFLF